MLDKFPDSPLASGARLRLGLALADNHEGGEAVLALNKLIPKKKPDAPTDEKKPDADANAPAVPDAAEDEEEFEESPILYRLNVDQVRALIDTLLNFAPIEELAATARTAGLDPVLRLQLTEPIAERLLAKEQFDEARKFMTPAQFNLIAGPLAKLTKAAEETKDPAAHAAACLKLGDAWAAARGKLLTFPLDTDETRHAAYIDFSADADVRRASSAPFIGATGNYKARARKPRRTEARLQMVAGGLGCPAGDGPHGAGTLARPRGDAPNCGRVALHVRARPLSQMGRDREKIV